MIYMLQSCLSQKRLNIRKDGDDENWLIFDQRTIVQQKKLRQKYEHENKQRHSTWHFSVTFKYKLCQISSLLCLKELNRNQCCWLTNFDFFGRHFLSDMLNFRLKWLKLHIEAFFTYLALKQIVIELFLHSSNQNRIIRVEGNEIVTKGSTYFILFFSSQFFSYVNLMIASHSVKI